MQNSPARSAIDVGSVIADTYTIDALIGRGGMGAVFLASHNRLPGKKVAIKILHAELSGEEVLARFRREAEIASRLGHPNIVTVHDFNVMPDGTPYLVLEYLHGESLAQRLRNGPLALEPALSIVRQVGSALAAAHREGIVHRDLKPQNIFLVPTEVDGRLVEIAKVLDFGISKIRGSQTVKTQDSALLGTPQYMAPEQATGQHKNVDERTDVFALGAIVYEMLSGQPAFSGETIPEVVFKVVYEQPVPLEQLVPGVSPAIAAAVHRAMAKQASERFANVGELVEALTGQPLTLARASVSIPPPDVGFAAGSRVPHTGQDAFAQTMGSGDHGPAVQAAPVADPRGATQTPASSVAMDATVSAGPGTAPVPSLVASGAGTSPSAAQTASTTPPASGADAPSSTQAPARPRKAGLVVAGVIGGAAIAAVATYMLTRPPSAPASQAPVAQAPSPTAPTTTASAASTAPADAAVSETDATAAPPDAAVAAAPPDAATETATPGSSKTTGTAKTTGKTNRQASAADLDDDSEDAGNDEHSQKLRSAEQALEASQWDRAERLAKMVTNGEDSTPRQKLRAALITGIVQCVARNDESRARAALRKLGSTPKLRRRLIQTCQRAGYLLNER